MVDFFNILDFFGDVILIVDEKASGTDGGTATLGAWRTRDLNTIKLNNGNHVSLATNQFTLVPGNYIIQAFAPANFVGDHQIRIRNITDATTDIVGASSQVQNVLAATSHTFLIGHISLLSTKTYELQHQVTLTKATDGSGSANSFGEVEIYTQLTLIKI